MIHNMIKQLHWSLNLFHLIMCCCELKKKLNLLPNIFIAENIMDSSNFDYQGDFAIFKMWCMLYTHIIKYLYVIA